MSRVPGSCHLFLGHVTCFWVMSFVSGSCQLFLGHAICFWVMSLVSGSCHLFMGHVTCFWVIALVSGSCHLFLGHVRSHDIPHRSFPPTLSDSSYIFFASVSVLPDCIQAFSRYS